MGGTVCIAVGLFSLLVGLFLAIGGPLIVPSVLNKQQVKQVNEYIVVDSKDSATYSDWEGGYDDKMEYKMVFYMWNLTNMEDVRVDTAKPIYIKKGPYVYRRHRKSLNVSFSDDKDKISYNDVRDYYFVRNESVGDETDQFTNINPVYVNVLTQANFEEGLILLLAPTYISKAIDFLTGPFINLLSFYKFSEFFVPQLDQTLDNVQSGYNFPNKEEAYAFFLNAWVNATQAPDTFADWSHLMVSYGKPSSGISVESATMLLNASVVGSLLNTDPNSAWLWFKATTDGTTGPTFQQLAAEFLLTTTQLNMLLQWFNTIYTPIIHDSYMKKYGLSNISDLGWVQWHNGAPLNRTSTIQLWPQLLPAGATFQFPWEIFWVINMTIPKVGLIVSDAFPSWQFGKKVLDPQVGLRNPWVFQDWAKALSSAQNTSAFGLNGEQDTELGAYSLSIALTFGLPDLMNEYGDSFGLFQTRSVWQWTYNCNDFILNNVQPGGPSCSMVQNNTKYNVTSLFTGSDDIKKINTYSKWRGQSKLIDVWNDVVEIDGKGYHTDLGQFQPAIGNDEVLMVFDSDLVRPLRLVHNGSTTLKDIDANSYLMDWRSAFNYSELYFQEKYYGIANLTSVQSGTPIFLSLWDMIGVENATQMVDGMEQNYTSEHQYNSVLIVEPITGTTISSHQRIQINLYLPPEINFDPAGVSIFGNAPPQDIFYPLMEVDEQVEISEDLAKTLRDKLGLVPKIKKVSFWLCVTIGPILVLLGLFMIVVGIRRRKNDYMEIN